MAHKCYINSLRHIFIPYLIIKADFVQSIYIYIYIYILFHELKIGHSQSTKESYVKYHKTHNNSSSVRKHIRITREREQQISPNNRRLKHLLLLRDLVKLLRDLVKSLRDRVKSLRDLVKLL